MADLYRKSSMEKLSNPEQLDRMIKITSPLSWLALIATLLIIAATVVWSIVGTLPAIETVSGVIAGAENVCGIYSDVTGTVETIYKAPGDQVAAGEKIAGIRTAGGEVREITAKEAGTLAVLSVEEGTFVPGGTEVARLTPDSADAQVVVCYVPLAVSQKLKTGMEVLVYPVSVDSQKYGHMEGEILSIDEYAANAASMAYVLGAGNLVAEQFAANGPVAAVVCKLRTDESAVSGFYWSGGSGKSLSVSNGVIVSAQIVVEECAPITKLIGRFQDN